jgi:hypothetical protein
MIRERGGPNGSSPGPHDMHDKALAGFKPPSEDTRGYQPDAILADGRGEQIARRPGFEHILVPVLSSYETGAWTQP